MRLTGLQGCSLKRDVARSAMHDEAMIASATAGKKGADDVCKESLQCSGCEELGELLELACETLSARPRHRGSHALCSSTALFPEKAYILVSRILDN